MNIFDPTTQGSDPQGRYIDRNVAAGIFGTVINATVFNQIGDESNNLIKAAGLTPSDKEVDQWLKAIQKLYGDADTALKGELNSVIDSTKQQLEQKINDLTASDIAFDDSISISASDVQNAITALHTLIKALKAEDISFDDSIGLGASNVQELGVKLNEKVDTEINDLQTQIDTLTNATIIADGEEHFSGKYYENADGGRKPIYYRKWYKSFSTYLEKIGTVDEWKLDRVTNSWNTSNGSNGINIALIPIMQWNTYLSHIRIQDRNNIVVFTKEFYVEDLYIEYTKTSDSWEY